MNDKHKGNHIITLMLKSFNLMIFVLYDNISDQEGRVMKPKNNPVSNHPENIFDRISPFKWLVQFSDIFATMLPWLTS